jgi:hypothetical protein
MKLEARKRLNASHTEDFAEQLVASLRNMSARQQTSLAAALNGVAGWFLGDYQGRENNTRIQLVAAVDLNLTANGMRWLSKVFGLDVYQGDLYRVHDLATDYVEQSKQQLPRLSYNTGSNSAQEMLNLVKAFFPVGSTVKLQYNKPLMSCTDKQTLRKLSITGLPSAARIQIPSTQVTHVFTNSTGASQKVTQLMQSVSALSKQINPVVWRALKKVEEELRFYAHQTETVCLLPANLTITAKILSYTHDA